MENCTADIVSELCTLHIRCNHFNQCPFSPTLGCLLMLTIIKWRSVCELLWFLCLSFCVVAACQTLSNIDMVTRSQHRWKWEFFMVLRRNSYQCQLRVSTIERGEWLWCDSDQFKQCCSSWTCITVLATGELGYSVWSAGGRKGWQGVVVWLWVGWASSGLMAGSGPVWSEYSQWILVPHSATGQFHISVN